jgi:serine/threonine protein kinase
MLLALLPQAPEGMRHAFGPGHVPAEPGDARCFVDVLSSIWKRRRLDRFIRPSARQESLLKGVVKPSNLGRKERDGLVALFGFDALNKAALLHRYDAARFFAILDDFSRISLPPALRAVIWTSMLGGLGPTTLREELHRSSPALKSLASDGVPAERAWEDGLLKALREVADRTDDAGLREMAEAAEAADDPVAYIASWASELEFSHPPATEAARTDPQIVVRPVEIPPAETTLSVPARPVQSDPADSWAFRTVGPGPEVVERVRAAVLATLRVGAMTSGPIGDMTGLVALIESLRQLQDESEKWLAELPELDSAATDLSHAELVYARLQSLVPDAVTTIVGCTSPADANAICSLLEREPLIRASPPWLWATDQAETSDGLPASRADVAIALTDPERRRRFETVIAKLDQLGEPSALNWLDAPAPGEDLDAHIEIWFERTRQLLTTAPSHVLEWLRDQKASLSDIERLSRSVAELGSLKGQLNATAAASVDVHLTECADQDERARWISAFTRAADSYRREYGDPSDMSFGALRNKAQKELKDNDRRAEPDATGRIGVEHNWTEASGAKATLVFHQPNPAIAYGILAAPVVLQTNRPRQLDVRLAIEVKGEHRSAWPKEWPDIEPSSPFTVPAYGWQPHPENDSWHFPVALRVPVRQPRTEAPRLEATIQVLEAQGGNALGPPVPLRWESIELHRPSVELRWAGTTNPEYVRTHPIGPQAQSADIMARFKAGGSVAVIAPRRFGKSTLVEFLLKDGAEAGFLTPPAIVCTDYAAAGGLDYERLWSDVSNWLYSSLGACLPPKVSGPLPGKDGFDQVRKAAKDRRYRAVVVLFDEAQLFFPHQAGADLGTRLKNLLERHWSRADDTTKVPVLFGFIGLPTMRERAGADLMALLAPIERSVINEADLRRLIVGMTTGLQSTRAARARLADIAGNLFILRVLLGRLVSRVRDDGRVWANSDDVFVVEAELKRDLLAGREEDVARYIRDALNGAEKVTEWTPLPAFPVAAALAEVRLTGRAPGETLRRVIELLNEWCRLNSVDQTVRAVYNEDIVQKHLAQLRERRVIKDLEFSSSLLEAWLQGVARVGAYEGFQSALLQGAQRRIELRDAVQITQGGQAEIWRAPAQDGKGQIAFRIRQLADAREEQQLQTAVDVFDALRGGQLRREPGADYLFEVIDVGLSAADPKKAVLVYRWIEGQDLSSRLGQLPVDIVVEIGVKLARALNLVHSRNIIHRDIRPANVILDDSLMRPVLIDFGFARRVGVEMHTRLAGDFCAPEVLRDKPVWTKAADVYSLAATLKALLRPEDAGVRDLGPALREAMAERAEDRPTADVFLDRLESLEQSRGIERKRQEAWLQVRTAIEVDKHKAWFSGMVNKFRSHLEAMSLGFYQAPLQRYREVADFLNQVLESYPGSGLSLKRLAQRDPDNASLAALLVIRNSVAHAGQALNRDAKDLLQKFQSATADDQRLLIKSGIDTVSAEVHLPSLIGLLAPFIR